MFHQPLLSFNLLKGKAVADTVNNILKLSEMNALLLLLKVLAYQEKLLGAQLQTTLVRSMIIILYHNQKV